MSVLSNVDFIRELGVNVYIYPLIEKNLKGGSINLTASKLAWSLTTHESIFNPDCNKIVIPAHDTALIETEEAIYISKRISGTYHSRVKLVSIGLGHVSTTLDPGYKGSSLIALHNLSNNDVDIEVGSEIVTLSFSYLKTSTDKNNTNKPGRDDILGNYKKTSEEEKWLDEDWRNDEKLLKAKLLNSEEYNLIKNKIYIKRIIRSSYFVNFCALIFCFICIQIIGFYKAKISLEYKDYIPPILTVYAAFTVSQFASSIKSKN